MRFKHEPFDDLPVIAMPGLRKESAQHEGPGGQTCDLGPFKAVIIADPPACVSTDALGQATALTTAALPRYHVNNYI